jgi:tetratricopeptide (TPR) repeat protein
VNVVIWQDGKEPDQRRVAVECQLRVIGLWVIAFSSVMFAIAPALVSPAIAADLNQQLTIYLNNRTRGSARDEADRLLQLGKLQESDGFLVDAINSWKQALRLYQDMGDQEAASVTYSYLGLAYATLGKRVEAEDALRRRLAVTRDREDFQGQISALNNLGRFLAQCGNFQAAQPLFSEALEIANNIHSLKGEAISHTSLGLLAASTKHYKRAIEEYEAALSASRRALDSINEAFVLNNLGDVYQTKRDYKRSINYYGLAIKLARINRDRPNQYRAIDGMVVALNALGLYNQSWELLNERLKLALGQENPRQEMLSLQGFGQLYQQVGDYPKAKQYYQQAIAIARALRDINQEDFLQERLISLNRDAASNH